MIGFIKKAYTLIKSPTYSRTTALLVILVLLAAVPLTVIVSQQQQEVRQRAAETEGTCSLIVDWSNSGGFKNSPPFTLKSLIKSEFYQNESARETIDVQTNDTSYTLTGFPPKGYIVTVGNSQGESLEILGTTNCPTTSNIIDCNQYVSKESCAQQEFCAWGKIEGQTNGFCTEKKYNKYFCPEGYSEWLHKASYPQNMCILNYRVSDNGIVTGTATIPTPTPTPSRISRNVSDCSLIGDINSCVEDEACAWGKSKYDNEDIDGFCTNKTSSTCPSTYSEWYWGNTTDNKCRLQPTPTPTLTKTTHPINNINNLVYTCPYDYPLGCPKTNTCYTNLENARRDCRMLEIYTCDNTSPWTCEITNKCYTTEESAKEACGIATPVPPTPTPTPTLTNSSTAQCVRLSEVNTLARKYKNGDTTITLSQVNRKARAYKANPCQ